MEYVETGSSSENWTSSPSGSDSVSKYPSDTGAASPSENWMKAPSGARLGYLEQVQVIESEASIKPRRGTAVERPGMNDYHENMFLNVDLRSRHAGKAVFGGEKWVCNRWLHPVEVGAGVRDNIVRDHEKQKDLIIRVC